MSTYSLADYGIMLGDPRRVGAYLRAMEQVIRPGCVVLDLGAGFGYFSLIACRLGAARVYAVEPAKSLAFLPELARRNGYAERIVVLQGLSTEVALPERVDVIVSDLRGAFPVTPGAIRALTDARERFLATDGVLIPRRDRLVLAPVDDRAAWSLNLEPWERGARGLDSAQGLELRPVREALAHVPRAHEIQARSLLAAAKVWAEVDYHTRTASDLEGEVEFEIAGEGSVHGFAAWFEADLLDGVGFATGPDQPPTVYGMLFFPLARPLGVQAGDRLRVRMQAIEAGSDHQFRWRTAHLRSNQELAVFDQNAFMAEPLDLSRLKRRLPDHVPALKPEAQIARLVLEGAADGQPLGQIASSLLRAFPQRFESLARAVEHAANTLERLNG